MCQVEHAIQMATPPHHALIEQVVSDACHLAIKSNREADLAVVHFLIHAWNDKPHNYKQWIEIARIVQTHIQRAPSPGWVVSVN